MSHTLETVEEVHVLVDLRCIESVPVWLLQQFPPLLNIGPVSDVGA